MKYNHTIHTRIMTIVIGGNTIQYNYIYSVNLHKNNHHRDREKQRETERDRQRQTERQTNRPNNRAGARQSGALGKSVRQRPLPL